MLRACASDCRKWHASAESHGSAPHSTLQCCLLEQLNQEPPAKGRGKRWMRCLTGAGSGQLVRSRRCRCGAQPGPPTRLLSAQMLLLCTILFVSCLLPRMCADATWPEICRRYLLTSRLGKVASAPEEGGHADPPAGSCSLGWCELLDSRQLAGMLSLCLSGQLPAIDSAPCPCSPTSAPTPPLPALPAFPQAPCLPTSWP